MRLDPGLDTFTVWPLGTLSLEQAWDECSPLTFYYVTERHPVAFNKPWKPIENHTTVAPETPVLFPSSLGLFFSTAFIRVTAFLDVSFPNIFLNLSLSEHIKYRMSWILDAYLLDVCVTKKWHSLKLFLQLWQNFKWQKISIRKCAKIAIW